jgi:hypothetical protein
MCDMQCLAGNKKICAQSPLDHSVKYLPSQVHFLSLAALKRLKKASNRPERFLGLFAHQKRRKKRRLIQ